MMWRITADARKRSASAARTAPIIASLSADAWSLMNQPSSTATMQSGAPRQTLRNSSSHGSHRIDFIINLEYQMSLVIVFVFRKSFFDHPPFGVDRASMMSVCEKSSPTNRSGHARSFATSYAKQSPKLRPARCTPLPHCA